MEEGNWLCLEWLGRFQHRYFRTFFLSNIMRDWSNVVTFYNLIQLQCDRYLSLCTFGFSKQEK